MFDAPPGETEVFDFDEIANHLVEQGLDNSPSELHGCLCGLLAAGAQASAEAGLAGLNQALNLDLHGDLAALVMQLYEVTDGALRDEAFDFHPLLPADDSDIESRTESVAAWCRGFLAGYARAANGNAGRDAGEILKDIAAIAEAAVDREAEEEESENSLVEIVEYLRFAVLNIFMDQPGAGEPGAPGPAAAH